MDRDYSKISMAVIRRLPKYYRYLGELLRKDIKRISSKEFSDIIGFTASQIRQDLNCFGGFGQQGYGYNVEDLHNEIGKILGLDNTYRVVIVGAGNMGQALANYGDFERKGFKVMALFDTNPKLIGLKIRDIEIMDVDGMESFVKDNNVNIAVMCTPKEKSQGVADILTRSGIKAIWNFSPLDLRVPDGVIVENVHLSESLFTLSYLLKEKNNNQ